MHIICLLTCTCEKCNQKQVIDCLFCQGRCQFAYCSTKTVVVSKVNSSFGTMAESCWESTSKEELFLTQSTFTVKSDEYDAAEESDEKEKSYK